MKKALVLTTIFAFCSVAIATAKTTASSPKGVLVAYFSVPEDGADAMSGESRIVVDNKVCGATQHIANIIAISRRNVDKAEATLNKWLADNGFAI